MTTIIIPWRDDGHRARACQFVCEFYRTILSGVPILLVDSGHEPFNRAASRNLGIQGLASTEVAVVADADTLPDTDALRQAIAAATDYQLHYPFTICHYLSQEGTQQVLEGQFAQPGHIDFSIPGAQGGIFVMRADAWRAAGGMDEDFQGWGYEDNAWHTSVSRRLGAPVRHQGAIWHLWHPAARYTGSTAEVTNRHRAHQAWMT